GEARSKGGEKGAQAQSAGEPSGDLQPEVVWVVCGLLRADRFKADCQAISSSLVIGFSIVLILLLLLTPFFKLSCIGSAERVQSRDGVFLAVSAFLGTGLLTLTLLDLYYYRYKFHKTLHCHLETFADRLNQKVGKEEELISQQLETFSKWHTECFDR